MTKDRWIYAAPTLPHCPHCNTAVAQSVGEMKHAISETVSRLVTNIFFSKRPAIVRVCPTCANMRLSREESERGRMGGGKLRFKEM